MTTGGDAHVDEWVAYRPNVVRSVAARVPGIDAEEAASRALEKMVRLVSTGSTIEDPAPYWRRAAVNEAISMTREAGRTRPVEDDTLDGLTPPVAGAELDAERQADVTMLRSALSDLADDDRKILLDRHVHDKAVTAIAGDLGVRPHAVTMRLRRAEERLAGAFAAAHAQGVNEPECRSTRAAMHDYLKGRLLPRRQSRLEVHMDGCDECTLAFIDVREVSWMLRDLGQHLIGGFVATSTIGTGIGTGIAAGGAVGTAGATPSATRPTSFATKQTAVAAGVLAALVIGAGAAAYITNQPDQLPVQAVEAATGGDLDGGAAEPGGDEPQPDPTPTPMGEAAPAPDPVAAPEPEPVAAPEQDVADPAPAPEPADALKAPALVSDDDADRPAPVAPAPKEPAELPAAPEPAPKPEPTPEPEPETPPEPSPPEESPVGGPPGNPDNTKGKGPAKANGQGPGGKNGQGPGSSNGQGHGKGNGNGRGPDSVVK